MAHDVVLPQMGESIAEGTITTWLKKIGDQVERDEPLFEMSTDKVDAEIPAPASGTLLEIMVQPGSTVEVGSIVGVIGEKGEARESGSSPSPVEASPASGLETSTSIGSHQEVASQIVSAEERRRTKSSPVVRKIAKEHGVDITQLSGTGLSGRVTKNDILAYLDASPGKATAAVPEVAGFGVVPEGYRPRIMDGDRVEEMSPMRAKIAEHMVVSKHVSPHVATVWEVDFSRVAKFRLQHKTRWQKEYGVNLTFTAFILKATVDALKAFPVLNASLDGKRVIYHRDIHLGIAVALDWGLLVPVIKDAGELNLLGLQRRAVDLAERARTKRLKVDEVQGGTFTVTNPGVFGPMFGLPVINQPQAAILGCGAVEKRPVVIDDMIGIRTRAYLSMSFDHRLVDGADADHFMKRIKAGIENFDENEL